MTRLPCFRLSLLGCLAAATLVASFAPVRADGQTLRWKQDDDALTLLQDDEAVFTYIFHSGKKPIIYPLVAPGGQHVSRDFPMKEAAEGETTDHIHQRSMWWTHGEVNDIDFWSEGKGSGEIDHREVTDVAIDNSVASFSATADWKTPDGDTLLAERKSISVWSTDKERMIDFQIELTAADDEVHFGDTKEGSFGIRLADSMMVDRKLGGKILNEHGDTDKDAWGRRARWVDYSGPVDGETVGVTILEHPHSFGHPTRWHVRSYGLFAANPFGEFHFVGGDKTDGVRIKQGESIKLRYLVVLHDGYGDPERIETIWQQFASPGR